eukprot:2958709-Prorocentrum_lima.AAC.1
MPAWPTPNSPGAPVSLPLPPPPFQVHGDLVAAKGLPAEHHYGPRRLLLRREPHDAHAGGV